MTVTERLATRLASRPSPCLAAFGRYCVGMQDNTRALEWAPKLVDDHVHAVRFLHTALVPAFAPARAALQELVADVVGDELAGTASGGVSIDVLRALAEAAGIGLALGYSEQRAPKDRRTELKLYVTTMPGAHLLPLLRGFLADDALPPPRTRKVMIAVAVDDRGCVRPRTYYLWTKDDVADPSVRAWLARWCSEDELRLLTGSRGRTVTLSFKDGARDMVYLSAPFEQPEVVDVLHGAAARLSLTPEQLASVRWVGFSKNGEGLGRGELNVYFPTTSVLVG